ncbi:hypothetical protein A6E01_05490 [Vibrio breoganii]|uniref:Uncharacterized protein n=1 Tax=Vibrio breoganii TaxID=553239 RepID=A0AAN1CRM4_9VIBR|nr:hypothetical protein A6E01_05490 [Vibrio breoganii]PMO34488.1 hypothetical protein BCT12_13465 [Vibrio breoganii]
MGVCRKCSIGGKGVLLGSSVVLALSEPKLKAHYQRFTTNQLDRNNEASSLIAGFLATAR